MVYIACPFLIQETMKVYVTRSQKLTVGIVVNGEKMNIKFDRGIRNFGISVLMAALIKDEEIQKALEASSAYGSEFWFHEVLPDVQPKVQVKSHRVIYYKPGESPEEKAALKGEQPETPATDYPEVTNGQKAKLLLLSLVKDSVHADFNTTEKARAKAKELNITFSNWPVQ